MEVRDIYMHFSGYVNITVEGFFVERFINSCFANGIFLWNLEREKSTYLKARVGLEDFKKIRKIAKNTKCRVKVKSKKGFPILIHRYKKRKFFFVFIILLMILSFGITRFIWNIDVSGNKDISNEEILQLLEENDIKIGMLKNKIDKEKLINKIRLERNDISWVGINVEGTNLKVVISEADLAPSVDDPNEISNIIADRDGEIAQIIVQSGTAKVQVGDKVKKGDLLVEGMMEGLYTGVRQVPAKAEIYAKSVYEKEEKANLLQEKEVKTGNKEKKLEIKLNNFKINFHKGVSKFEKYDTIMEKKKVRFFSNYYLPLEVITITNFETVLEEKQFTLEELVNKEKEELEEQLNAELKIENMDNVTEELEIENNDNEVTVKLKYIMLEKIGTKENIR